MFKKSRLMLSMALLVQSFTLFVLFLILCVKKRSIAAAFLAVATMEGAAGAYLFAQVKEELEENDFDPSDYLDEEPFPEELELDDEMLADDLAHGTDDAAAAPKRAEIPLDDGASEDEFKNHGNEKGPSRRSVTFH